MLLSFLDNFFTICSWWMLPLLFISWLLGSWYWNVSKGSKLRREVDDLKSNVAGLKTKVLDLKSDLNVKIQENNVLESDKADLRSRVATAEGNYFAEKEAKEALEGVIAPINIPWNVILHSMECFVKMILA